MGAKFVPLSKDGKYDAALAEKVFRSQHSAINAFVAKMKQGSNVKNPQEAVKEEAAVIVEESKEAAIEDNSEHEMEASVISVEEGEEEQSNEVL